ncbi:SH3 domain-containing protein [Ferrigenium sp. UT5]|uniref:SH3 domain-containing protein n=1 Tax=Ferrigenium sp. UT5 TaxID=3242105 RepID=UPI003551E646
MTALSLLLASQALSAAEYVSVATPAILYDANSLKAKKLYVATRYLPLEKLVELEGWVKARDATGKVFWIEKRNLSSKRYVVVTAREAIVRESWSSSASLAFRAERQVGLEWLGNVGSWVKVRHRDGSVGFIKNSDVWGE